ncbi:MAG: thioredoxin [Candidatus Cyclobacteriaceae bacterium M3_2C_046]
MDFDIIDFEEDVIKLSYNKPVLVDFWAPWCGPCKIIGPVLERLAQNAQGSWELRKLNVDENQDLATAFQVRSIPTVKLFIEGEVVNEFAGALPEVQIEKWLKDNIPSEEDHAVEQAEQWMQEGKTKKAVTLMEKILKEQPDHAKAAFMLGQVYLFDHPEKALDYLKVAEMAPEFLDQAIYLKKIPELISLARRPDQLEDHPVKPAFLEGLKGLADQHIDLALQKFIEVIMKYKAYHNELAREACIAIFFYLGPQHDLTRKYRRRFDMALY